MCSPEIIPKLGVLYVLVLQSQGKMDNYFPCIYSAIHNANAQTTVISVRARYSAPNLLKKLGILGCLPLKSHG